MKTKGELLDETYLCKADIRTLFDVSKAKASRIYGFARELDDRELGDWVIYENKVRMKSVLKVQGLKKADLTATQKGWKSNE